MTRAVEDALNVIASGVASREVRIAWPGESIAELDNAGKVLARHIAAQDAEIARLREALKPLAMLDLVPGGFDKCPDDQPVYARDNSTITVGDVRRATAALEAK